MDTKQAQQHERFARLGDLIEACHDRCKNGYHTVETLIDEFCRLTGLADAFGEECSTCFQDPTAVPNDTSMLAGNIQMRIMCSVVHLRQAAAELGTGILEQLMAKRQQPPPPPEQVN